MDPLVSIIIPVYNGSNYMREALDSALAQTYSNIEILVVNDGSNDGGKTRDIALSYGDRIRYLEQEKNGGVSTVLNMGIRAMRGEYFSWLSHDDVYYPEKIQAEIDALRAAGNMDAVVYSGWDTLLMPERRVIPYEGLRRRYRDVYIHSGLCAVAFGFISGGTLLIPRSWFDRYGLFDERLRGTQDYVKWFEMFHDKELVYVDERLVQSREHEMQVTYRYTEFQRECDELHLLIAKQVTEEDTQRAGLTLYQFLCGFLGAVGSFPTAREYVWEKLQTMTPPKDAAERLQSFRSWLQSLGGTQHGIYLYCAGQRGEGCVAALQGRGVSIAGIADSNPDKWGQGIAGMTCLSPQEIPNDALLIVTKIEAEGLRRQLRRDGFQNVVTYEEMEERMFMVPVS